MESLVRVIGLVDYESIHVTLSRLRRFEHIQFKYKVLRTLDIDRDGSRSPERNLFCDFSTRRVRQSFGWNNARLWALKAPFELCTVTFYALVFKRNLRENALLRNKWDLLVEKSGRCARRVEYFYHKGIRKLENEEVIRELEKMPFWEVRSCCSTYIPSNVCARESNSKSPTRATNAARPVLIVIGTIGTDVLRRNSTSWLID